MNKENEFIAHELKNALNMMMASCTMAQKHIDDRERVLDYLNTINMTVNKMAEMIDSAFNAGQKNNESKVLSQIGFTIDALEKEVKDLLTPLAMEKDIKFIVSTEKFKTRDVFGDYGRLLQVIVNLAINSIKYTHYGGVVMLRFEEEVSRDGRETTGVFICSDNGIGISEEFLEHIFEPYARSNDVRTKKIAGTGLGMSIVKENIDAMGGSIHIESSVNVGTRVTIRLRLKKNTGKG